MGVLSETWELNRVFFEIFFLSINDGGNIIIIWSWWELGVIFSLWSLFLDGAIAWVPLQMGDRWHVCTTDAEYKKLIVVLEKNRFKNTTGSSWSGIYLSRLNVKANQNWLVWCEETTLNNFSG